MRFWTSYLIQPTTLMIGKRLIGAAGSLQVAILRMSSPTSVRYQLCHVQVEVMVMEGREHSSSAEPLFPFILDKRTRMILDPNMTFAYSQVVAVDVNPSSSSSLTFHLLFKSYIRIFYLHWHK